QDRAHWLLGEYRLEGQHNLVCIPDLCRGCGSFFDVHAFVFRPEYPTSADGGVGFSSLHGPIEDDGKRLIIMRVEGRYVGKPETLVVGLKVSSCRHFFDPASGFRL
ncbi:MAG: hypothetical protein P8N43_15870, partial [Alphaproteobacteria bacterium]|nr:hypothetical protein [Alphaproteobacteria bacterium]